MSHLVDLAVFNRVFGDGVCDLRTEDEEDGLQGPHSRLPFGALCKAVNQVEQLLCCLCTCARTHTHTHNENLSRMLISSHSVLRGSPTCHVSLRSLVEHGELVWVVLHPVPEGLQRQSSTAVRRSGAEASARPRRTEANAPSPGC